jgi:indole-3-glycerol phosphate synthase
LAAAREATPVPVLRKDFTLDPLHVLEARAGGADAVLLIVRILSDRMLAALHAEANALGMSVLVEVHDRGELARALELDPEIVGINNRDLATFRTDLGTTLELLESVPDSVLVVSESGIRGADDVLRLGDHGVDAVLVGETLLRAPDPERAARDMASVTRRERVRG